MCGICGIINFDSSEPVSEATLRRMCEVIRHRGPDEDGFLMAGNVGLGMRRLKIIDLSTGKQPIFNEDQTIAVVFNGEIYDYQALREQLMQRGHAFYTKTDTEVIVHAYEEYGDEFLTRLNGMFAIALWDSKRQRLLLARDHVGIKPLHYAVVNGSLIFGSELKSLLCDPRCDTALNPEALYHYATFRYIPCPFTIYRGVEKLPPGCYLTWQNGQVRVARYWQLEMNYDPQMDEAACCDQLLEALKESVKSQMVSDVPLGAFLSGGMDSSTVVALMSAVHDQPVKTFSIGFEEATYNELEHARVTAQHFHTEHYEEMVRPSAVELVDKLLWHFDEPFGDSSAIPTYVVSQLARRHVTVVLSGDGGDECFGGYTRYQRMAGRHKWRRVPSPVKSLLGSLGDWLPRDARGKEFLKSLAVDDYTFFAVGLSEIAKRRLFTPEFLAAIGDADSFEVARPHFRAVASRDDMAQYMYLDTMLYLPDDILCKVDRASMAHSIEARVPLLDRRVMEFAATIPPWLKVVNGTTKHILKKTMSRLLPPHILHREKHGFSVPLDLWMRGELKPMLRDTLSAGRVAAEGIFDSRYVSEIIEQHLSGRKSHKSLLWSLLMFQRWHEKHLSGSPKVLSRQEIASLRSQ